MYRDIFVFVYSNGQFKRVAVCHSQRYLLVSQKGFPYFGFWVKIDCYYLWVFFFFFYERRGVYRGLIDEEKFERFELVSDRMQGKHVLFFCNFRNFTRNLLYIILTYGDGDSLPNAHTVCVLRLYKRFGDNRIILCIRLTVASETMV